MLKAATSLASLMFNGSWYLLFLLLLEEVLKTGTDVLPNSIQPFGGLIGLVASLVFVILNVDCMMEVNRFELEFGVGSWKRDENVSAWNVIS